MKEREITKKYILTLQQLEFEAEISQYKSEKQNVEEKFKEFVKTIKPPKPIILPSPEKLRPSITNKENPKKEEIITKKQREIESFTPKVLSDNKPEIKTKPQKLKLKPPTEIKKESIQKMTSKNVIKYRIRINKFKKYILDRYIQCEDSFNPFDDNFNKQFNRIQINNEDIEKHKNLTIELAFKNYWKKSLNGVIGSDDEEEETEFSVHQDAKHFQNMKKQFLKQKRSHTEF
jgi:hypothetical protein